MSNWFKETLNNLSFYFGNTTDGKFLPTSIFSLLYKP